MIDYTEVAVVSTFVRLRLLPEISCVNVWTALRGRLFTFTCVWEGSGRWRWWGGYTTRPCRDTKGVGNEGTICTHRHVARAKNMPGQSLRYMYSKAPDVYTKTPGLYIYTQTPGLLVVVVSGLNTDVHSLYANVRGLYTNIRDLYIVLSG